MPATPAPPQGQQEAISDITAIYQSTAKLKDRPPHAHDGSRQNNVKVTQRQALVQWEDTIEQQWVIDLSAQLGYYAENQRPAKPEEVERIHQPCEYCILPSNGQSGDIESDQCVCDVCWRVFHETCLTAGEVERWQAVQGTEAPFECRQCHHSHFTAQTLPQPLQWCKVRWQPRLEPLDDLEEMIDNEQLHRLMNKRPASTHDPKASHPPVDPSYLDLNLSLEEQQGHYGQKESVYDVTHVHGQHIRTLVRAHPEPINPHLDIISTGEHEVMIRSVYYHLNGQMGTSMLACLYAPTGQGTFTITRERLRYLYSRFQHTQTHHGKIFSKFKANSFPEEFF
jgi:hypothetical protein